MRPSRLIDGDRVAADGHGKRIQKDLVALRVAKDAGRDDHHTRSGLLELEAAEVIRTASVKTLAHRQEPIQLRELRSRVAVGVRKDACRTDKGPRRKREPRDLWRRVVKVVARLHLLKTDRSSERSQADRVVEVTYWPFVGSVAL